MKYTFVLLLLVSSVCYGGGDAYPLIIEKIDIKNEEYSVVFKLADQSHSWYEHSCLTISVSGSYDSGKWKRYQGKPMSLDAHYEALDLLSSAYTDNLVVWFGGFGRGLQRTTKCNYSSKGLFSVNGYIFSIYHNI